ncbi:glycosylphosphatidylinositol-anchored high density lipoprotein-binding protein 1-like [Gracilinanus agilis]|uniref:glycosylphosphatidylinositol-anchored high density lipoprotein-binding protein 1-like n=1 Tax=Gracilinanus agilis TaxID=191870 RepID=UPI001CFE0253|nr:glycosylphosphatidylinositol-anchored high density lipoprotein-binding protein 1-like [Gracilinanus agilis]
MVKPQDRLPITTSSSTSAGAEQGSFSLWVSRATSLMCPFRHPTTTSQLGCTEIQQKRLKNGLVSTTKTFRDLAAVPSHTASQRVPVKRQASESTELDFKGCPVGMRVFITILLAALLCLNQGSGQKEREWADESKDDYYDYKEYDEDDDEEDEEEDTKIKHIPYEGSLECYTCESVPNEESCNKIQTCPSAKSFCKTIISKGNAESKFFTTYSAWCSDTCQEATKIIDGTHVTMSCCQFDLCNPLWIKGRVPRLRAKGSSNCGGILMSLGVVILGMLGRDL